MQHGNLGLRAPPSQNMVSTTHRTHLQIRSPTASLLKTSQSSFLEPSPVIKTISSLVTNLHVNDALDTDSAIFNDSIDALGPYQHVGFTTHKSGNMLDLILSDITDNKSANHHPWSIHH